MKIFYVVMSVVLLNIGVASAAQLNDSWGALQKDPRVEINWPLVTTEQGFKSTLASMCVADGKLRSVEKITECKPVNPDYGMSDDNDSTFQRCENVSFYATASLDQNIDHCAEYDDSTPAADDDHICAPGALVQTNYKLALAQNLKVYQHQVERGGEDHSPDASRFLFSKAFKVPSCS